MDYKEIGRKIQSELMGAQYVEDKGKKKNAFNGVLHEYSEEVCFGRVWSRPGIDRKQRSILNVVMLTALNRPAQLKNHVEGALNNGCTRRGIAGNPLAHRGVLRPACRDRCVPGCRRGAQSPQARGMRST